MLLAAEQRHSVDGGVADRECIEAENVAVGQCSGMFPEDCGRPRLGSVCSTDWASFTGNWRGPGESCTVSEPSLRKGLLNVYSRPSA